MMKTKSIPLGRIWGISIGLDWSWFLIFGLLTWTFATATYPAEFAGRPVALYWILGAVTAIMLFVSVLLHELGHSFVALRYKIPVPRITLFIFGGVAQIATEPPTAAAEFWIALAGPLVSLLLAGFFTLLRPLTAGLAPLLALIAYLGYINGALVLFNLIPGFPLDGGRVLRAIIWGLTHSLSRATRIAAAVGQVIAFGFMFLGIWQVFAGNLGGLWLAMIGWFLASAATSQVRQQRVHDMLAGHSVLEAMSRTYGTVAAGMTLQEIAIGYDLDSEHARFVVQDEERSVGILTLRQMKAVPLNNWATTTAAKVMVSLVNAGKIESSADLWEALETMEREGVSQLSVVVGQTMMGLLTRDGIARFLGSPPSPESAAS